MRSLTKRSMPLYSAAIGVCAGIALAFLFTIGVWVGIAALIFGAGCTAVAVFEKRPALFLLAAALFAAALGIARTEVFVAGEAAGSLAPYAGKERVVEGVVVNDPERRETSLHAYVQVHTIDGREARGTLLAILARESKLGYGDSVRIEGDITLPESFETGTGHIFDYPGYLRARGISAMMRYGSVTEVEAGGFSLRGVLFDIKHVFERSLERMLPEPDASLMEGMLIGERRGIPEDINNAFIIAGLIHIVVLSGYNISIVAEQVLRLFGLFARKKVALVLGAVAIVLFVVMVGGGATAVRAGVMGLIAILARVVNRPALALRALALAAAGMVLWNPAVLLYDPSFILSVLATFGLITLSPWAERYVGFIPEFKKFSLRSIAATTIGVQIFILPALLYYTGIFSVWALPANLLALPLVPFAMLSGFITGVIGLLSSFLALPFTLLAHLIVEWLMLVATLAAAMPLSSFTVAAFPAWVAALIYVPLTFFAIYRYQKFSTE